MKAFTELVDIMHLLREKCPWDSVQTHESLIENLRDETREVEEAILAYGETGDGDNLCEELGDVMMLLLLNCMIAEEEGIFTVEDVLNGISHKMKFRHPKIFSPEDKELNSLGWEELKMREKAMRKKIGKTL